MEKKEKRCPLCGSKLGGYPAVSRVDNKTHICSECGIHEAFARQMKQERDIQKHKYGK